MATNKQRRDAARRRMQRQTERRRRKQQSRKRNNLIFSVVGTLIIIGVVLGLIFATNGDNSGTPVAGHGSGSASAPPTSSPPTSPAATPGQCRYKVGGTASRKVQPPPAQAPTKGTVDVQMKTSQGPMTFTLDRTKAPCAVESFTSLAGQRYFDGTPCHRLTTQGIFVLQCGDPSGTGSGGPGYSFGDELTGHEKYTRGVLAMANSGPNTNGSQFFIVYKDSQLGPQYTVFGTVKSGLGVVDKVAARGPASGTDGKPKLAIDLTHALVLK